MTVLWCVSCDNLHGDSAVFGPKYITYCTHHPLSSIFSITDTGERVEGTNPHRGASTAMNNLW